MWGGRGGAGDDDASLPTLPNGGCLFFFEETKHVQLNIFFFPPLDGVKRWRKNNNQVIAYAR